MFKRVNNKGFPYLSERTPLKSQVKLVVVGSKVEDQLKDFQENIAE